MLIATLPDAPTLAPAIVFAAPFLVVARQPVLHPYLLQWLST